MTEINDILAKHFSGNSSPEEEQLIQNWKVDNQAEYAVLSETWGEKVNFKVYDNKNAWSKIENELFEEKTKTFKLNSIIKYAAAACIALMIGFTAKWFFSADEFIALENNTEQVQKHVLPDGTEIWLAPDAELEYAHDFKNHRAINLEGEAFFEVARDEEHPFIIDTEMGEVEVLGTGFNVLCNESSTIVSVSHGRVELRNESGSIELSEGQCAEATENNISEVIEVNPNYQAWKTGEFIFINTPLTEVVNQLNKYFEKEIVLESNKGATEKLTANFNGQNLEDIIEIIVLTCDVVSESSDNKVILK